MRTSDHRLFAPPAPLRPLQHRVLPWVAGVLLSLGCATPPRPSVNAGSAATGTAGAGSTAATAPQPAGQSTSPVPGGDVDFEEDQLPSAPEDVVASPIDGDVGEPVDVEELPDPSGSDSPADTSQITRVPASVVTPVPASVQAPVSGSRARMLLGFRVQIHAGESRGEAEELAREAQTRLHVTAYTTFEHPFYKVRLGDFLDRADALVLRERVRSYGYSGAWVVTTPVLADAAAAAATRAP